MSKKLALLKSMITRGADKVAVLILARAFKALYAKHVSDGVAENDRDGLTAEDYNTIIAELQDSSLTDTTTLTLLTTYASDIFSQESVIEEFMIDFILQQFVTSGEITEQNRTDILANL